MLAEHGNKPRERELRRARSDVRQRPAPAFALPSVENAIIHVVMWVGLRSAMVREHRSQHLLFCKRDQGR